MLSKSNISPDEKRNRLAQVAIGISIVTFVVGIGWAMIINTEQVRLQTQQADSAKVQAENSTSLAKLAQEQVEQKKIQDEHNQILNGISIHPFQYSFELKIDESGKLHPGQSFEIINGSERIATEISAYWEIVGTDYGNPEGWGAIEPIEFDKQTLRPLEQMMVKVLPSQLAMIASPDNKSKAIEYYGYLRIVFSDSRFKKTPETVTEW